ncbi:hypothetical protein TS65_05920, partial [Aneurinibacillus migulanus]
RLVTFVGNFYILAHIRVLLFSFQGTFKLVSFFVRLFIFYQITKRFATSFLRKTIIVAFRFFRGDKK